MKNIAVLAGLTLALSACGDKSGTPAADTTAAVSPPPAAAAGATHNVQMVMEGTTPKFVPNELSVKAGDQVVFTYVGTGGPHNVAFYADSVPAGAVPVLMAQIKDGLDSLSTALLTDPNTSVTISFAGAPAGEYKFTCTPHSAMGMHGKITVTP